MRSARRCAGRRRGGAIRDEGAAREAASVRQQREGCCWELKARPRRSGEQWKSPMQGVRALATAVTSLFPFSFYSGIAARPLLASLADLGRLAAIACLRLTIGMTV